MNDSPSSPLTLGRRRFLASTGALAGLAGLGLRGRAESSSGGGRIQWDTPGAGRVIRPGQLHGDLDREFAGAGDVLDLGDRYRMYYWGKGSRGSIILMAETPKDRPNDWKGVGGELVGAQPDKFYNNVGPSFPFVFPVRGDRWHMLFCGWGRPRADKTIPNWTCLAVSEDAGTTWRIHDRNPIIPLDRPYDGSGTGSTCVVKVGDEFRLYYTSIGPYFDRPAGTKTGHGNHIPWIGVGFATSRDGITWDKPSDHLMIEPRGRSFDPFEYINSKPWVFLDGKVWRMFIGTYGTAYRIRSLVSDDGLHWTRIPSGPDGDLGVGPSGAFDDHARSYTSVLKYGDEYRMWYTGNGFGQTGMGYCTGRLT